MGNDRLWPEDLTRKVHLLKNVFPLRTCQSELLCAINDTWKNTMTFIMVTLKCACLFQTHTNAKYCNIYLL